MSDSTAPDPRKPPPTHSGVIGTWARRVPKAEIHLHLEGSVDLETLVSIAETRAGGSDREARSRFAALYSHRDFIGFLENFRRLCAEIRRPDDFALITSEMSRRLQADNVRYAEVFCSPTIFRRWYGLPADEIMQAVSGAARRREEEGGPRLRFLFDGVRQFGVAGMEEVVTVAAACRKYDVIGIGMGGDEKSFATSEFAGPYGEFDGPRSVWEALEVLQAERIGHGVRACEDPALVAMLVQSGHPLECCPTSNVLTGVAPSWERHPLKELHRAGVAVTVNSDDPAMFATSVEEEWERLTTRLGLSPAEVLEIGVRTARAAFLPETEREALVTEMRTTARACGVGA